MALLRERLLAIAASSFGLLSLTLVLPVMAVPTDAHGSVNGSVSASASASGITDADVAKVKGEVGVAVVDTVRKKQFMLNQDKPFPMQSVCKLPVAIAVLRLADAGKLSIQDKITVRKADVVPFYSPIKEAIKGKQSDFTIRELMTRAVCSSDNTACDLLIARAGGASAVTAMLKEAGITGIRVDRPEGTLQPESVQIAKFLKDPRDTALPQAMVEMLQKLHSGNLLSKSSTAVILEDLFNCKTGPARIKAGLPVGWTLAHKTGTGRDVAGQNTATNDVGVAVGPHGETIYIAVFTKGSRAKIEEREAFMAKVAAKAVAGEL